MKKDSDDFATLHEIVKTARGKLDDKDWDYLIGGADTETTVKRNRRALDSLAFRPRVLRELIGSLERAGRKEEATAYLEQLRRSQN